MSTTNNTNMADIQNPFKPDSLRQEELGENIYILESKEPGENLAITYRDEGGDIEVTDISGDSYSEGDIFQMAEYAEMGEFNDNGLVEGVEDYLE